MLDRGFVRKVILISAVISAVCVVWGLGAFGVRSAGGAPPDASNRGQVTGWIAPLGAERLPETPVDPPAVASSPQLESPAAIVTFGPFRSIQVNVNAAQNNIVADAANEPTIAISPVDPDQIVIAWRQFDTITNNFRQAGIGYSHDRGQTWTKFTLDPGQFRSDPVLATNAAGTFFLSSLSTTTTAEVWRSLDGGVNWAETPAFGGDKQWLVVDDRSAGVGAGHIYQDWNVQFTCCPPNDFTRSIDNGVTFQSPRPIPTPSMKWGTMDVGSDGTLYFGASNLGQSGHLFTKSTNASNPAVTPTFDPMRTVNLGGQTTTGGINPAGLLGQVWIAVDTSNGPTANNLYMAGSVTNGVDPNPTNVKFIRSVDGGQTWSSPVLVNDDPNSGAWHWFGTMSVAPNGRIDVIWNDTRHDPSNFMTEVFYSYSVDAGLTWAPNIQLTPPWNPQVGWPQQNKIGDYYHMISDASGAHLAYAATFNGEEDVYYLHIQRDCNGNDIDDDCDIACGAPGTRCDVAGCGTISDCNNNVIPDDCEPLSDCNTNTIPDICDIGSGTSDDCNLNSIPDECESAADCNNNTIRDICDLAAGTSQDCNGNQIPDECDISSATSADANGNGIPDECEGACCTCTQCTNVAPSVCGALGGVFSGLGVLCGSGGACVPAGAPANDSCAQAVVLPGNPVVNEPFDNRCATLDGPTPVNCPAAQGFGTDLWYKYTAPCSGTVTASLCNTTNFDSIMDVYGGGAVCPCPITTAGMLVCGDDTCGPTGGPSRVTFNVTAGMCYTIRVAGWEGEVGDGILNITYNTSCTGGPATPLPDGSGVDKVRFISMVIPGVQALGGNNVAIRVALTSLHHVNPPYTGGTSVPFTAFEGQVRWVGPPTQYIESTANPTRFYASDLQCAPHYREWNTIGVLHVTGSAVVPSSNFNVQTLAASCQGNELSCPNVSGVLPLSTTRWGDVAAPFNPPDGSAQPDVTDISELVNKFRSAAGAMIKVRALLVGDTDFGVIDIGPDVDFKHISACVDAFKGNPYPYAIEACP